MPDQFDISTIPEIAVTRLQPYRKNQACPKCGNRERRGFIWLLLNRENFMRRMYCVRGGEATVQLQGPDGKTFDAPVLCAGISGEHLNLQCPGCGFKFMSEVKTHA